MSDQPQEPDNRPIIIITIEQALNGALQNIALAMNLLSVAEEALGTGPLRTKTTDELREAILGQAPTDSEECSHPQEVRKIVPMMGSSSAIMCEACGEQIDE